MRLGTELEPELEALLAGRQAERILPADVRARVLARVRASVSDDRAVTPLPLARRRVVPVPVWRRFGLARVAAVILILVGAAGALAALHERGLRVESGAAAGSGVRVQSLPAPEAAPSASVEAPPAVTHRRAVATKLSHVPHEGPPSNGEIELVERVHLACARHDYGVALALIQEHTRRFPHGPLAEEREALRIEALAGLGSTDEARRHAAVFATRFPRSVLLSRVREALKETAP